MRRLSSRCHAAIIAVLLLAGAKARADYPIASHRFLADPASLVHGNRLYLYASNDDDNTTDDAYLMKSIVCVSTVDLKNWTDHGEVLRVPRDASWANMSWAPALAQRLGVIYMYFGNNANGIGVVSSTSPTGPFTDPRGSALITASTPGASGTNSWLFDPGVFIDDNDDEIYLYFGGNGESNARVIRLNPDMISVSGSAIALNIPYFFEAAWMHKRDGVYYLSYSTNPDNGLRIDYLTSSSPTAGFTHRGTVGPQPPSNGNNNHAAIFVYNGNWYHAYHNRYVANQTGVPPGYKRNLALERLNYAADGTMQEVVYTTDGVLQLANLNPYTRVEAETFNAQSGIETEVASSGGMNLTSISDGDWVRLRGVDFGAAGARTFSARVASATGGGAIELRLTSTTGMVVGTLPVPNTGGAQMWRSETTAVTGATGVKDLYLHFTGGGFNVDSWEFAPADSGGTGGSGGGGSGGAAGSGGAGGAPSGGMGGATTGGVGGATSGGSAGVGAGGQAGTANGGSSPSGGTGTSGGSTGAGAPNGGTGASTNGGAPTNGGTSPGGTSSSAGSAESPGGDGAESDSSSGCGCRTAKNASSETWAALLAAVAFAFAGRRKLKRRSSAS